MPEIKYDRQSLIPNWDQSKLSSATVAVVGAGALGNHVCQGLIGLGIGTIKIYDHDKIEAHNLNRQSLFCEDDVGKNKAEVLAQRLAERNSSIFVAGINEKIDDDNIDDIFRAIHLVIDCVDLISVRRVLSRFCLTNNIPLVHGGISWFGGQAGILTREHPCINCIYPQAIQKMEMDAETSCTRKPEASVVYIAQIIAGFMVQLIRQVLLPLQTDVVVPQGLLKLDFRLNPPVYFEPTRRMVGCECVKILQKHAPDILIRESKLQAQSSSDEANEMAQLIGLKALSKPNKKMSSNESS